MMLLLFWECVIVSSLLEFQSQTDLTIYTRIWVILVSFYNESSVRSLKKPREIFDRNFFPEIDFHYTFCEILQAYNLYLNLEMLITVAKCRICSSTGQIFV